MSEKHLLYTGATARCVSKMECHFGEPGGVKDGDFCISMTDFLKSDTGYVSLNLNVTETEDCPDTLSMIEDRICGCPEQQYIKAKEINRKIVYECQNLPSTFNEAHLRIDIEYTYKGVQHVQHRAIVSLQ